MRFRWLRNLSLAIGSVFLLDVGAVRAIGTAELISASLAHFRVEGRPVSEFEAGFGNNWEDTGTGVWHRDMLIPGGTFAGPFEEKASRFSPLNAYLTMWASHYTHPGHYGVKPTEFPSDEQYEADEKKYYARARSAFRRIGFDRVEFVDPKHKLFGLDFYGTQAIVAWTDSMVMVVYRGTEFSRQLWEDMILANAETDQVSWAPGGMVHEGWKKAADAAWPRLAQLLSEAGAPPESKKPVWITGHSLGGAIATVTAYRLEHEGYPVQGLYAHATPRVGDSAMEERFRARGIHHVRYANYKDPVPYLVARKERKRDTAEAVGTTALAVISGDAWTSLDVFRAWLKAVKGWDYAHMPGEFKYIASDGSALSLEDDAFVEGQQCQSDDLACRVWYELGVKDLATAQQHDTCRYTNLIFDQLSRSERLRVPPPPPPPSIYPQDPEPTLPQELEGCSSG